MIKFEYLFDRLADIDSVQKHELFCYEKGWNEKAWKSKLLKKVVHYLFSKL